MDPNWVAALSPKELFHRIDQLTKHQAQRLREDLRIQVAAAAVTADGGKMAQDVEKALGDAAHPRSVAPEREAAAPLTMDQMARIHRDHEQLSKLFGDR